MQLALTAVAVLVPALLGPVLVRRGAAVMARAPQAASIALLVVLGIWLAASASLIVALAGAVTGPGRRAGTASTARSSRWSTSRGNRRRSTATG